MALSLTQQILDRSIFHAIDRSLTEYGYAPDRTLFDLTTGAGRSDYSTANKLITTGSGDKFGVLLIGHSNSQFKGNKQTPRIVIDPYGFLPGDLGLDPTASFELNEAGDAYNRVKLPTQSSTYEVNVHIVGSTALHMVMQNALLSNALGRRGYIPVWPEILLQPAGNFFYENLGNFDSSNKQEGVIEKIYRFLFPDVYETECPIEEDAVALINEITLQIELEEVLMQDSLVVSN